VIFSLFYLKSFVYSQENSGKNELLEPLLRIIGIIIKNPRIRLMNFPEKKFIKVIKFAVRPADTLNLI